MHVSFVAFQNKAAKSVGGAGDTAVFLLLGSRVLVSVGAVAVAAFAIAVAIIVVAGCRVWPAAKCRACVVRVMNWLVSCVNVSLTMRLMVIRVWRLVMFVSV